MNITINILKTRDLDELDTVEELMLVEANLESIDMGYQDRSLETPEWVIDRMALIRKEIDIRLETELRKRLRLAKIRRDGLKTRSEKRKDLDAEIKDLEEKLK